MLNEDQVRHVAKLARIALKDEEVKKFSTQLSGVFEYMDILNEVDVSDVAETSQLTGLINVTGKDKVSDKKVSREEILACTELPIDSNQIRVLPAIK
jgi:aspartyl-tRNA(Asn)/glutamyl-tRNA(Gln) amidotransferase subunit C